MLLCFDATRFNTGLDGAIELAAAKGLSAIEYSLPPFARQSKAKKGLDKTERESLDHIKSLSTDLGVKIACLNLDYCLYPLDKKSAKSFQEMITNVAQVSSHLGCNKISMLIAPGLDGTWLDATSEQLTHLQKTVAEHDIKLLLRLATAPQFRGKSLKSWTAMEPQDWRDLLALPEMGIALSFSPADCVWLGIDYLKILSGIASGIEHIEAHDIEINRSLLNDSGMYGPLWWRYRIPGKGQVDWTQLTEALKLYDFKGTFSIHLDDEFVANDPVSLDEALDSSIKHLAPLMRD
jgi:sugar phosphate isomerase/epimerase